ERGVNSGFEEPSQEERGNRAVHSFKYDQRGLWPKHPFLHHPAQRSPSYRSCLGNQVHDRKPMITEIISLLLDIGSLIVGGIVCGIVFYTFYDFFIDL